MKLGIIGTGNVGCAIALAAVARAAAHARSSSSTVLA
jgi:predicted dinucleotide-binding enzyme